MYNIYTRNLFLHLYFKEFKKVLVLSIIGFKSGLVSGCLVDKFLK